VGGDANMKGFALPNVSRLLVFALGGTATLPETPRFERPPMDPPPFAASQEVVATGAGLYDTHCGSCHGAGVIGVGILPDLRRTPYLHDAEAFNQVVLGGSLAPNGMASFSEVVNREQAAAIRAFIILRANQDAGTLGQ